MPALERERAIPVTVLTGFLGAGKTTLLNHLLRQPALANAAVLINEFGEVAVDHHLVDKIDDNVVVLASGCLCCSVRGELARSLRDLFMRRLRREIPAFSRLLIETTGLADPAPVLLTLREDFFIADRFRIDAVVTAVDVTHARVQLGRHFEAVRQVAMADRLLLTKCDLATPDEIARVACRLARVNPGAAQIEVRQGAIEAEQVMACGLLDAVGKTADVRRWLAAERVATVHANASPAQAQPDRHDALVQAFVLCFDRPFAWPEFAEAIDVLLATCGERILRVKGLLNVEGESGPRVVQCVQHTRYPESTLPAWPDDDHHSRLVFIVRALARDVVEKAFAMFCAATALPVTTLIAADAEGSRSKQGIA